MFEKIIAVNFQSIFISKHIKIIFFILKKLFLISAHQNNKKNQKNINLKKYNFFFCPISHKSSIVKLQLKF
jgi:hypothetical protein